uniref:Uncharacterized protein n=1 Tax=Anopheles farauti TaxID=69004 RepID=A0A182QMM4_9DIPT
MNERTNEQSKNSGNSSRSSSRNQSSVMKFYLFLAIVVCESCNYFSHAEFDSLVEVAGGPAGEFGSLVGGHRLALDLDTSPVESPAMVGEWSPSYPWSMAAIKRNAKSDIQTRRRSALDKNFMRFGRSDKESLRQTRANLMRFGRPDRNFLRFGRDGAALPYLLRAEDELSKEYATSTEQLEPQGSDESTPPAVKRNAGLGASEEVLGTGLSESGEQIKPKQIVYYRRDSPKNLMRFGKRRSTGSGYMRFGRAGNLMRFGRAGDEPPAMTAMLMNPLGRATRAGPNLMRFGRAGNLMRFGRAGNGTGTQKSPSQDTTVPSPAADQPLPANLAELFEKDPDRMLLEAALVEAGEADEHLPLYIVEK